MRTLRPIDLERCRRLFALALAAAAAHHALAIVVPRAGDASSPGRHALFVVINLVFAVGFLRPWRGFPLLVAALCAQQIVSHGATLVRVLRAEHRLDWPSIAVLIVMPLATVVVFLDTGWRHALRRPKKSP
jgi:hypothetical protein